MTIQQAFDYKTATSKQLAAKIASIKTKAATITTDVQQAGLAAMLQIQHHNNVTPLNNLYLALGSGMRKAAFMMWATRYAGVSINTGKDKESLPLKFKNEATVDIDGAIAEPWDSIKSEPSPAKLAEVGESIAALLGRLSKAPSMDNPALYESLKDWAAGKGIKLPKTAAVTTTAGV